MSRRTPAPQENARPSFRGEPTRRHWGAGLLAAVVLAAIGFAWLQPAWLTEGAHWVGYGICHQLPERSLQIAGRPLPLCARCTGTFLGVSLGLGVILLRRRQRCRDLPPLPVLILLLLFFAFWAVDGLNSYLTLFEGVPHLYEPHNLLRLTTGMLNGLVLSNLAYPVFSITVWDATRESRSIENLGELGVLLGIAGALIGALWLGWPPLVYILSLASVLGVVVILTLMNTLIAVILMRRENRAHRWADVRLPAALGLLGALLELLAITELRSYLTHRYGLPF